MHKEHYSRFLKADIGRLHFAAHSHHPWPDISRDAQIAYWDDSTRMLDNKWEYIFSEVVPSVQRNIAEILGLATHDMLALAPNSQELVVRLISCFTSTDALEILTTDSEFHSFSRQSKRLLEVGACTVKEISVDPWSTFEDRFVSEIKAGQYKLVYLSHVFFTSGLALRSLERIVEACESAASYLVVDGYHSFCALPVSLSAFENRLFYIGGGYKYAQSGEGIAFMAVPKSFKLSPVNTGWFAAYGKLINASKVDKVVFAENGFRFWGSTFPPDGMYRFNAVASWMKQNGFTIEYIHQYVRKLQCYFLTHLDKEKLSFLGRENLVLADPEWHAHFFTFIHPDAVKIGMQLQGRKVTVDVRGDRIRIGFGLYQDEGDIDQLFNRLRLIKV